MNDHSNRNKASAQAFYHLMFDQGDPRKAIEPPSDLEVG